ncbi:MAG: hypothetical protein QG588_2189 [Candidatus Poribacteria bacterium]|nr:hypothetical protein [Candidatus Poribacteria bacterium]
MILPAHDVNSQEILSVIAKRTYDIRNGEVCIPSEEQMDFVISDVYCNKDDLINTNCEFESDLVPYKLATDVVLLGKAYAIDGYPVERMDVSLEIGSHQKTIRVIGNRYCKCRTLRDPWLSDPQPFTTMELRYDLAYGGVDMLSQEGQKLSYPRNPIGRGFVVKKRKECVEGLQLPNIEDPCYLLTPGNLIVEDMKNWERQPNPQGFGWYGRSWQPRISFFGIMPAHKPIYDKMKESSADYVPQEQNENFKKINPSIVDFRFFNGASPGLILSDIKGDENVRLVGMDINGSFSFKLPGKAPVIMIDIGEGFQKPDVALQTVCIMKEENKLYMVWRGAIEYIGLENMSKLTNLEVKVE